MNFNLFLLIIIEYIIISVILIVLKSEVDDLRVLLASADKQLSSLKKERNEEIIEAGRKYATIESKVNVFFRFLFIF